MPGLQKKYDLPLARKSHMVTQNETNTNELEPASAHPQENPIAYPLLVERVKALMVDGFVLIAGIVLAGISIGSFENTPAYVRGAVFIFLFFLYEPVLVSIRGGTIGHSAMGLKVKSHADRNKNMFLLFSIFRSAIKWLLGWLSFLTMISNKERRAIHDLASNSIVLYRDKEQTISEQKSTA
jgi:uncharacterized RDD family membrane protein YckC